MNGYVKYNYYAVFFDQESGKWCFICFSGLNTITGWRDTEDEARKALASYQDGSAG